MKTTLISSMSLWAAPRSNLAKLQSGVAAASIEMTTGRAADVGLRLGSRTAEALSVRGQIGLIDAYRSGNAAVATRLDAADAAMDSLRSAASQFAADALGALSGGRDVQSLADAASAGLASLTASLNVAVNGQYVFGGANTSTKPVAEFSPGSPAGAAIAAAFQEQFGCAADDPQVASISASELNDFLDGPFSALFSAAAWSATWSSASDAQVSTRVSETASINTALSANDAAFRTIAMGYAMFSALGAAGMGHEAQQALLTRGAQALRTGADALTDLEATTGVARARLSAANEDLEVRAGIYQERLADLEGADPVEAKTRIDELSTQIQTSYALTAQIRDLSLLNFL